MAILKHLPSHNKFYQDAVNYFLFQHDDHARPIYNAQHKMILRDNVLIDAINTDVWSYSTDYNGPPVKTTLSNFIVNQIFPILTLAASRATPHI